MALAKLLESQFRGDIRFRGEAYVEEERVAVVKVTADDMTAVVRDHKAEHETTISRHDGDLKMFCSCSADAPKPKMCKHLWAAVLTVDKEGLLSAPPSMGKIPPFLGEVEGDDGPIDDMWVDDLADAAFAGPDVTPVEFGEQSFDEFDALPGDGGAVGRKRTRSGGTATAAPKRQLAEWQTKLRGLRKEMKSRVHSSGSSERDREIFYEIDLIGSREAKQLVIEVSQRQRRANGQWGKVKPLKVKAGQLEEIELDDDRQVLSYLFGSTAERNSWYAQQAEIQAAAHRYRVPIELARLVLPMMSRTGRMRLVDGENIVSERVRWDDSAPWSLCLAVEEGEAADEEDETPWVLAGSIRREDEEIPTDKLELLVPGGIVVTKEWIARLDDFGARDWVWFLSDRAEMKVPEGDATKLVDELLDMPSLPRLQLPEELKLEEVRITPTPVFTVRAPQQKGFRGERLRGTLEFDYDGVKVQGSSQRWAIVQRDQGRCLIRDRELEAAAWETMSELAIRRVVDPSQMGHDVEIAAADLGPAVRKLIELGWEVRADGKEVRQASVIQFRVESNIDWFGLSADVDFDGKKASFPELLAAISRGDTTIRLDDGSLGVLPEEWVEQYGLLAQLGEIKDDELAFSKTQAGLLDALLQSTDQVEVDEQFAEIRERLASFDGVEEGRLPDNFTGDLRPYQRQGLGWMQFLGEFGFGGCLADDMGLGKTVQMLAMFQSRKERGLLNGPSLVVVPKSLLFNWQSELERFTPSLSILEYTGPDREVHRESFHEFDIIITTYGTLRRDAAIFKDIRFDYAVLDEAQTIKNASSQVAKAARLISADNRLALSGTPIENHLGDLWSIFEFLNPGMLGRSQAFKASAADATDKAARNVLSRGLKPFVLRRTKGQVAADLPEKVEETLVCEMEADQRKLYDELRAHYRESLLGMVSDQGIGKTKMHVLEALLRLRQAACHPALLDEKYAETPSAKMDMLHPRLEELIGEGHKSLVFSQFTSMLSIVREKLDESGIKYSYLDGQTRSRKKVVDEFQDDDSCGVFLISLKAGGLGLNLTAAEYVFLLDPWWNPAVEAQAIDRAHRVGQTKNVFAYRLICRNTVEEKILELQKQKRELAETILEAEQGSPLKDMTSDDLELLLS